jgi:GcrA cell cycle regulator
MDWTDDVIDRLKALWMEGLSTAEIGRRMGVSKNAVVGKAHRLALAARPSPIRRGPPGEAPKRPAAKRVTGPTLPPMEVAPVREAAPVVVAVRAPVVATTPTLRSVGRSGGGRLVACCWPIGEPGTKSFRFCDVGSLPGKPYCAAHAALAYVRVRDRREDAA